MSPSRPGRVGSRDSTGFTLAPGKSQAVVFVALKAGAEVADNGGFLCF